MRRSAALFAIALALGATILAPRGGAQAQDRREEGPSEIEKCQTIDKPGSYKLVNNLKAGLNADCLVITANFVTIDLAGFTITGNTTSVRSGTGILAQPSSRGLVAIAVRNGSISNFFDAVDLSSATGSVVEGLRVFGGSGNPFSNSGITANGVVKGNTVIEIPGSATGSSAITATGTVTGNYVIGSRTLGYVIGPGSTVIGNTSAGAGADGVGFDVQCPSNVTDNTVTDHTINLWLHGDGCNNTNNVAP
jgi:hypothetical protein